VDDDELAKHLFEKVKPYLPERIEIQSRVSAENGQWSLTELNNRLRFCRYSANQYFHRHLDGVHYRSTTLQSKLTFMIYLNGATEFEGGRTLFYKTKDTTEIWAAYIPRQGDLIVFDHNVWHEGELLSAGEKFVLRSDILYSKINEQQQKKPFEGHLGYIWKLLKFDSSTIISGGRDRSINVWNFKGEHIQSLNGHQNSILDIEKMDDQTFISCSRDQHVIIWKRATNQEFEKVLAIKLHSAVILSLCKITDAVFVSGGGDKVILICNLSGEVYKTFSEHTNWVWQVIKLKEDVIASGSEDKTIKIWNTGADYSLETFEEESPVFCLAYNAETNQLISGNLNGEITIRTLTNDFKQLNIQRVKIHDGIIRTIKIINNRLIATGGEDNKVKIWDNQSGQLITELEHANFVQSLERMDDNTLLSASYDGTIKTWKI
jgi:WD40 repeat protein